MLLFLFLVPSENKKDQRSIEQTLADIQSKKRMKLNHQSTDGKDGTLPKWRLINDSFTCLFKIVPFICN